MTHLGPIAGEISSAIVDVLPPHTFVGVTAQGFVRVAGADGRLTWRPWHRRMELLRRADVVLLSDEDIAENPVAGRTYLRQARLGLLTRGPRSIEVYERGSMTELAIAPKLVGDTNGAGDVFAAALFGELARSGALGAAVDVAVAAAALWVERPEPLAFPTRARVEQRVRERA